MSAARVLAALVVVLTASAGQAAPRGFVCPHAWVDNRMPGVVAPGERARRSDYFIVDGVRRAIRSGERALARRRCGLAPRIVW